MTAQSSFSSVRSSRPFRSAGRGILRVEAAISRAKKESIVEKVKSKLESSSLVFGIRTEGLTVEQIEKFRNSLPVDHASVYVCKNSLLKIAADEVEGWSSLRSVAKYNNAFVFVDEDGISSVVKSFVKFEKEETQTRKENAEKDEKVERATEIYGGTLNGQLCSSEQILKLKDLPTKPEALANLLGILVSAPVTLLTSLTQSPIQLAVNMKMASDLDEDKTKSVKEFVKE